MRNSEIRKIAFVGDYLPRKCGIATFTHDMYASLANRFPEAECFVVPVNDRPEGYDYPQEVRFEIDEPDLESYRRAADFLNFANTDVICLQHEYGIFGGTAGSHVLGLLRDLRMPVVTTFHTVLREPNDDQRRVLVELAGLSARVVVMTEVARTFLRDIYCIPEAKIDLIAHGIPDTPFVDPNTYKDQFGVEGRPVALTFGLLSPNKGIEHMLRAIPELLKRFPNLAYIVLGATHPDLIREQGERYRLSLERLARDLGISEHVMFYNRFVELNELTEFIRAADVYVTPYLNPAQITSGTLAYSFGCGKAIVSTPYWHAEELLADGRGVLVPFADPKALAREICGLLRDEPRRKAMCEQAYRLGREMVWEQSARLYMESFQRTRLGRQDQPVKPLAVRTLAEQQAELPDWRLDHLSRLTDATGMFQHATHTIPNFAEGYCTDDNARALLLTVLLEELGQGGPLVHRLATTYAAFVQVAFDRERRRFRNFLGFDRRWLEDVGSEDSHGRAVWALGTCVGRSRRPDLPFWAASHFELALPAILEMTSPRTWAFGLLGIQEYLRRLGGDRLATQVRDTVVRGDPQLRHRPAAASPDRRRPQERQRPGTGGGLAIPGLAGKDPDGPPGALPGDRLYRVLPQGGRSGPVRPAADRGQRDGFRLPGGVPGHPGFRLDERGTLRLRVVPRPQRPGPRAVRPGHRGLLRRSARGPDQPEPGCRIDPRLPPLPRRDEAAGKLPGDIPPGAVIYHMPRMGRHSR
jgi:glycosyltransferase involved in cell wall biosynthesis